MSAQLDKARIAALIPHAGAMCLLDSVISWNAKTITCVSASHRQVDNPLAAHGRLDVLCGIEYAAQAMAVHGGLTGTGQRPAAGYLASLRDVICSVDRLDTLEGKLLIAAELLIADANRVIYRFSLTCNADPILSGQAAVVLDATPQQ